MRGLAGLVGGCDLGLMLVVSFCFGGVGVGAASGGARGAVEAGGGDHGDDHGGVER